MSRLPRVIAINAVKSLWRLAALRLSIEVKRSNAFVEIIYQFSFSPLERADTR